MLIRFTGRAPGGWLLAGCLVLSGSVYAQSGGSAPVVSEESSGRSGGSNAELFFLVEELRQEVRQLRGQLEENNHQIERLNRQGRERYVDLDERLMELNARVAELEDEGVSAPRGSGNRSDATDGGGAEAIRIGSVDYRRPDAAERDAYAQIQHLIQEERDFETAIDRTYDFLDEYPEGDLAVNAYYWLGELYLAQEAYEQARQAFRIVTSRHETHRKAPDALYKLAVTLDREGDTESARDFVERLQQRYAGTEAAALGRQYFEN